MIDPIGGLIAIARKKVDQGREGYTAYAKSCSCFVEVNLLGRRKPSGTNSTREHYSRCSDHPVR
jgi:hypothetical protein